MANDSNKHSYNVLRRLVIGAFTPAVAAALVGSANDASAAMARKAAQDNGKGQAMQPLEVGDLVADTEPEAWWPYFQTIYVQSPYSQSIYIQCYTQYPQCGPTCW